MGPKSNDRSPKRRRRRQRHTGKEEADTGEIQLQAKEHQSLPGTIKAGKRPRKLLP